MHKVEEGEQSKLRKPTTTGYDRNIEEGNTTTNKNGHACRQHSSTSWVSDGLHTLDDKTSIKPEPAHYKHVYITFLMTSVANTPLLKGQRKALHKLVMNTGQKSHANIVVEWLAYW